MKVRILLVVVAVLVVAVAVLYAVPLKSVAYQESEPYVTTETYYVTEPRTEEIPLNYRVIDTKINNCFWKVYSDCSVTIKNTDSESGYFRVVFDMITVNTPLAPSKTANKAAWQLIAAGKQETVTVRHDGDYLGNFTYEITPPTREVTTSQQVAKTREVTKYREVEKIKKVTYLEYWME